MSDASTKVGISSGKILDETSMVKFAEVGYANFDGEKGKFVFSYKWIFN